MRSVSSSTAENICLPTGLSVSLSVCLSERYIALGSDVYKLRHCLGLSITFFSETSPSQNNPNWSTQRKYVVVTLDQTSNSGGECVCPVFQGLRA